MRKMFLSLAALALIASPALAGRRQVQLGGRPRRRGPGDRGHPRRHGR